MDLKQGSALNADQKEQIEALEEFGSWAVTDERGWGTWNMKSQSDYARGALASLSLHGQLCMEQEGPTFYSIVKKPFGTTLRRHKVRRTPFSEWPKMAALYSVPGGESSQLNVKVTKRHLKILSLVTHVWWWERQRRGCPCEGVCRKECGTLGGSPARQWISVPL